MNKKINITLILLAVFMAGTIGFAQGSKGKARKYIRQADLELYNNNFKNALDLYRNAYALDTNNAQSAFKLASCMYQIKKYKRQSLPYFEKAQRADITKANYYLGNLYRLEGKFQESIRAFQDYKNSPGKKYFSDAAIDTLINKNKTAMEFVKKPVNVSIENIGSTINSEYPDYVPLISADESILIFTSRRKGSTGGLLDPFGEYFEDVYISTKKEGQWTAPKSISSNINTATHDACAGLSADGEVLFLYRTSEDLVSGDLYVSVFYDADWTVPEKLPAPINTENYTEPSASLLSEGQTLYFSSNRPGGYGKKDIYRVVKLGNGQWSKAVNLGPTVNTAEDEDSPFIHPDGKTLYFSSKGHKNMGGYDIFKTTLTSSSFSGKDVWSEPENLGYPVNTPDDDIYFVLSTDGKTGYYSSDRPDGYGATDIYLIRFLKEDFGLIVFKGMVVSADSADKPIKAKITLMSARDSVEMPFGGVAANFFDLDTNKVKGIYNTNQLTGRFIMIVSKNKDYMMKVESEGYIPFTGKINSSVSEEIHKIKLHRSEK